MFKPKMKYFDLEESRAEIFGDGIFKICFSCPVFGDRGPGDDCSVAVGWSQLPEATLQR